MLTKQDKQYLEEKYYDKLYLDEQFRGVFWEFNRVHERIDVLDQKMDALENKIDMLEQKIDALGQKMDEGFKAIIIRFDKRLTMLENHCFLN